jgi:hypothetical protein
LQSFELQRLNRKPYEVVLLLIADPRVNGIHEVQTHPSAEQLQVRELVRAAESALRSEASDPAAV